MLHTVCSILNDVYILGDEIEVRHRWDWMTKLFYVKHEIKTNQSSADTGNPFFSRRYRRRHQKNEDMSADTEKSQRCVSAELCCSPEVSSPISTVMLVKDNCWQASIFDDEVFVSKNENKQILWIAFFNNLFQFIKKWKRFLVF